MTGYEAVLADAAQNLELDISSQQIEQLLSYHALLMKWNKAYNLTAVRNADDMIHRHLVDSFSIVPYLRGTNLLDVGCGGGLPGLVIAIMRPDLRVTLLDSNGKKTRFCHQVKTELALKNVFISHCRLEDYQPDSLHDCITSRAFATLADMVTKSVSCIAAGGYYLAMKGAFPDQELADLPGSLITENVIPLAVPGETGQRHLVVLKRID